MWVRIPPRASAGQRGTIRTWVLATGCSVCGHPAHRFDALPLDAYAYLLGLYLGDGTISAGRRGVFRLRIALDQRYPGIVASCAAAVQAVVPRNRVLVLARRQSRTIDVSAYSKQWPCLLPQHGAGRKHDRSIRLATWQLPYVERATEGFLRGLIHSDGCRSMNRIRHRDRTYAYPRYHFSNASADIRALFTSACDDLGVRWRTMNARNVSVSRREDVERLDRFIGPKH